MRFCKFCKKNFALKDMNHWVPNGSLKSACKVQRAAYRVKNRELIRQKQNLRYKLFKRTTPLKADKLIFIKDFLLKKDINLMSTHYVNNKSLLSVSCSKCAKNWSANWNNLHSGSSCPECAKVNRAQTNIARYGVTNPTQNSEIRLRAAKSANKIKELIHWKTKELVSCQGSYEVQVVNYFNKLKIDFKSQECTFLLSDGTTYTPDFYIVNSDLLIEVKGYFYPDSKVKFELFCKEYNNPIEVWNRDKIKELEKLCR